MREGGGLLPPNSREVTSTHNLFHLMQKLPSFPGGNPPSDDGGSTWTPISLLLELIEALAAPDVDLVGDDADADAGDTIGALYPLIMG